MGNIFVGGDTWYS